MKITASHSCRALTEDEYCDLNLSRTRDTFMERCQLCLGNKMKMRDSTVLKVEIILANKDPDYYRHTYFSEVPVDKTPMSEQDVIEDDGKPIDGFDHIVD